MRLNLPSVRLIGHRHCQILIMVNSPGLKDMPFVADIWAAIKGGHVWELGKLPFRLPNFLE